MPSSSSSATSSLPSFLALPLDNPSTFDSIARSLTFREHARINIAQSLQRAPEPPASSSTASRILHKVVPTTGGDPGDDDGGQQRFSMGVGLHDSNAKKNRYCDIIAYDRTRLLLPTLAGTTEARYVNASLVREPDLGVSEADLPRRWWVAAQAPITSTIHCFLSLLLHPPSSPSSPDPLPPVRLIVQLTPLVEQGRQKCHPYFPNTIHDTWHIPAPSTTTEGGGEGKERGIWVRLEKKSEKDGQRTSELTVGWEGDEEGRKVVHAEYLGWGDHGIPDDPVHLVNFIRSTTYLNTTLSTTSTTPSPILLHCSAGVGRTGTYITISSLLPLLSLPSTTLTSLSPISSAPEPHPLGTPYPADLPGPPKTRDFVGLTIDGLREQRCTMVQNQQQVRFCFEALKAAWEELEKEERKK